LGGGLLGGLVCSIADDIYGHLRPLSLSLSLSLSLLSLSLSLSLSISLSLYLSSSLSSLSPLSLLSLSISLPLSPLSSLSLSHSLRITSIIDPPAHKSWEFGGPIGTLGMMLGFPCLMCEFCDCVAVVSPRMIYRFLILIRP
jgi:hypothetical protein